MGSEASNRTPLVLEYPSHGSSRLCCRVRRWHQSTRLVPVFVAVCIVVIAVLALLFGLSHRMITGPATYRRRLAAPVRH